MADLEIPFGTTTNFEVTVTAAGAAVTGATVTVDIDLEGVSVVDDGSMTHQGAGVYRYVVSSALLTELEALYDFVVTAVNSGNTSRKALKVRTVNQ